MSAETAAAARNRHDVLHRVLRALPALTLLAVLTITASAEYELARTVLDLPPQIAWALPAAIDSYVLAALHTRRDVPAAIAVMAGALTASMAAHLAVANRNGHPLPASWTAPLATAIMTVLVVVAWRVHVLIAAPAPATEAGAAAAPSAPHPSADNPTVTATVATTSAVSPATSTRTDARMATSAPSASRALTGAAPIASAASTDRHGVPDVPRSADPVEAAAPSASDAQILATITAEPPSMRALMREYGIGQARATRLRRLAQQHHNTNGQDAKKSKTSTTASQQQPENASTRTEEQQHKAEQHTRNERNPTESPEREGEADRTKTRNESHTGITDRVGQPRSTKNVGIDDSLAPATAFEAAR